MAVEFANLTPEIGTRVFGTPEELIQPEVTGALRELLRQRGVLVFKELNLTTDQQVRLGSLLGTLREEGDGNIFKITLDPKINPSADYLKGSFLWHMDGTHDDTPVFASLLSGRKLSAVGGQTDFANSYAAYDALSPDMKARIADMRVLHSFTTSMIRAEVEPTEAHKAYWATIPEKIHNLVWTHKNGRKSLVIGCHAASVIGMEQAESDALLAELMAWVTQPRFTYRHEWTVGDLLIWDNTGVLHRAEPYPLDSGRVMDRTTLMGEEAFA